MRGISGCGTDALKASTSTQLKDRVARAAGRRDLNFPVTPHSDWLVRAQAVCPLVDLKNTLRGEGVIGLRGEGGGGKGGWHREMRERPGGPRAPGGAERGDSRSRQATRRGGPLGRSCFHWVESRMVPGRFPGRQP